MDIWELLGIDATADMSKIKSAYAQEAKQCHPEEEPEAFMALQKAYKAAAAYARKQGQKNDSAERSFEPGLLCVPDTAVREKSEAEKTEEQYFGLSYDFSILDFYDEKERFFRQCMLVVYNPFLGNNVIAWELFLSRPSFGKLFQDTVFRKELIYMVCRTHPKPPWKRKTLLFFEEYMKQYHTEENRPEDGIWETQLKEFRQAKRRSFWFRTTLKGRFTTKTGMKFHEMLLSGIKKDRDALDIGNRKDMEDYLQAYLAYADDHEKEVCLLCDREKEEKTTQETDFGIEIPTKFLIVCFTGLFFLYSFSAMVNGFDKGRRTYMNRQTEIRALKGIGEKTAAHFARLGIFTVKDLLEHYPVGYDTFQETIPIHEIRPGELCAVQGRLVKGISGRKLRNLTVSTCQIRDESGELPLTFFNMPYLKNMIKPGVSYIFRGVAQGREGKWKMEQPAVYTLQAYSELLNTLQPRYSLTAGLTNHGITKAMKQAFSVCTDMEEYLPAQIRERYKLTGYREALEGIHFPVNEEMLRSARRRLVFDEFFLFMIQIRKCRENSELLKNPYFMMETADTVRLLEKLPYCLTAAQKRAWEEIRGDLQGPSVMNRLVQGDVGSGKTIIAVLALLMTVSNGYQGAMMAPTEVLARQHFENIAEMGKAYGLPFVPALLTGSMTAKEKRETYARIESGQANVIVGTHALIQEKVIYRNLALVITDEQHRFGVRQREALAGKGTDTHVLVMSATPIPRTLAIILYGDLHVSVIDELPANRLPIKNCVVGCTSRATVYQFIQKEVEKGRQAYVICPMVEEGEMEGLENVIDYTGKLRNVFPDRIQISYLHGKMKSAEKNRIMEAFGRGDIDILVSTTVIEVGINVPNATVMMVENAERFGLAQLHQLRGRVGRGKEQSYCIFVSSSDRKNTMERLSILNESNDGFYIAGEDMRLRGPGDLFGIRQSGSMEFKIADIYQDAGELRDAGEAADIFLKEGGDLSSLPCVDFRSI